MVLGVLPTVPARRNIEVVRTSAEWDLELSLATNCRRSLGRYERPDCSDF